MENLWTIILSIKMKYGSITLWEPRVCYDLRSESASLHPMRAFPDKYIWLNRDYKPLGCLPYGKWVDYGLFTWLHVAKDDPRIAHLSCLKNNDNYIFLFDDGNAPAYEKKYAERLLGLLEQIFDQSTLDDMD